jgi:hypothetical protein
MKAYLFQEPGDRWIIQIVPDGRQEKEIIDALATVQSYVKKVSYLDAMVIEIERTPEGTFKCPIWPEGTFKCPICGRDHPHSAEEHAAEDKP